MDEIEWKIVKKFPQYEVSNTGLVRHVKRKKILKPYKKFKNKHSNIYYLTVTFQKNLKKYNLKIHRLILETFKGPPPNGMIACHNDGNRLNNNKENLRWATPYENAQDAIKHGTIPKGENHGKAKLKQIDVDFIRYLHSKNLNQTLIAKMYKISITNINHIVRNKLWKN